MIKGSSLLLTLVIKCLLKVLIMERDAVKKLKNFCRELSKAPSALVNLEIKEQKAYLQKAVDSRQQAMTAKSLDHGP